jgi:hypothetical protein
MINQRELTSGQRQEIMDANLRDITDDSAGKSNWTALEDFVGAVRLVAENKGISLVQEVGLRRQQIERNFLTVFGRSWLDDVTGPDGKYVVPNELSRHSNVGGFFQGVVCPVINTARYGSDADLVESLSRYDLTYY